MSRWDAGFRRKDDSTWLGELNASVLLATSLPKLALAGKEHNLLTRHEIKRLLEAEVGTSLVETGTLLGCRRS